MSLITLLVTSNIKSQTLATTKTTHHRPLPMATTSMAPQTMVWEGAMLKILTTPLTGITTGIMILSAQTSRAMHMVEGFSWEPKVHLPERKTFFRGQNMYFRHDLPIYPMDIE